MRILVISDSHGNNNNVKKAIAKAGKINYLFHCGDVCASTREIENEAGVLCYFVAGNSDGYCSLLQQNIIQVGKHRIFMAHGHKQAVHAGLSILRLHALQNQCDIAFYGHTHVPFLDVAEGDVTILNPGSITNPRQEGHEKTFAILEFDENTEDQKISVTFEHID